MKVFLLHLLKPVIPRPAVARSRNLTGKLNLILGKEFVSMNLTKLTQDLPITQSICISIK